MLGICTANFSKFSLYTMILLAQIGFRHPMFIWSGDILMRYALLDMLLPCFRCVSGRKLLTWTAILLFLPVTVDIACEDLWLQLFSSDSTDAIGPL